MSFTNDQSALENQLPFSIEFPEDPAEFRTMVNDIYQKIANAVNSKTGGLYVPLEKGTSELYYTADNPQQNQPSYRMVVNFGALPNTSSKSVNHNITGWNASYRLRKAYGASTDPVGVKGIAIPNDGILLEMDQNNVIITTSSNLTAYTETDITLEYTKG